MNNVQVFDDTTQLAETAAQQTVAILKTAIRENGSATWVLAGGSTPLLAYKILAANYLDAIDWSQVTVLLGDERIGPMDGPDNNGNAINNSLGDLSVVKLFPKVDVDSETAAAAYEQQLAALPRGESGLPRLDLVWLGVGEDGHTMSLFPRHDSILPSGGLVATVSAAPKPPADRISLTLRALQGCSTAIILAAGSAKKPAITEAIHGGHTPIAIAASIISTHEGTVIWMVDQEAAPTD